MVTVCITSSSTSSHSVPFQTVGVVLEGPCPKGNAGRELIDSVDSCASVSMQNLYTLIYAVCIGMYWPYFTALSQLNAFSI